MALLIRRERIILLYEALGFKTAQNWDDDRLLKKVESLSELTEDVIIKDPEIKKLLDKILKAGKIKIKTDKPKGASETDMAKKKGKKKSSKKSKAEMEAAGVDATPKKKSKKNSKKADKKKNSKKNKTPKKDKKSTKKTSEKKLGVIDTIADCLRKEHTTAKNIVKVLVKKFPNRNKDSMENTTNRCIKSYLEKEKGITVSQDSKGKFFIK